MAYWWAFTTWMLLSCRNSAKKHSTMPTRASGCASPSGRLVAPATRPPPVPGSPKVAGVDVGIVVDVVAPGVVGAVAVEQ